MCEAFKTDMEANCCLVGITNVEFIAGKAEDVMKSTLQKYSFAGAHKSVAIVYEIEQHTPRHVLVNIAVLTVYSV
jgi:hypothetical protein